MIAPKEIKVTIDGKECVGREGQTILDIATAHSINIPTLCHLKTISPWGGCRMCIVEVKGSPKVVPSCATPAMDGGNYVATSDRLQHLRRLTLELLFTERNHICPFCSMNNGDCELQQQAYRHGMDAVRLQYLYPTHTVDSSGKYFAMDHNRCILCGRCVRTCEEIEGVHTLDISSRGEKNRIVVDLGATFGTSETCTSCGACVAACPTGTLFDKASAFRGKLNTCEQIKTTCTECPVGCGMVVYTKENRIVNVFGDQESPVSKGHLCVKGRYQTWAEPRPRITQPLIRADGKLKPATYEEAAWFLSQKTRHQSAALKALLVSPRVTNETIPALMRVADKFDRTAMYVGPNEAALLGTASATPDAMNALHDADAIIVLGAHPSRDNGVVAAKIRTSVRRRGAKLLLFHSHKSDLDLYADIAAPEVSLERKFWARVAEVLNNVQRPVLLFGPDAMSSIGVTVLERLIKVLEAQKGGQEVRLIALPTSSNSLKLASAGVEIVENVASWIDTKPLDMLYIIASDEPDGGAHLLDEKHVAALIEEIGCVVVQASYESRLSQLADVVLPAAIWSEKSGTVMNFEGRELPVRPVLPARGAAREDSKILEAMLP